MRAERIDIRRIDVEPMVLEEALQFLFERKLLLPSALCRVVGRLLDRFLLVRRQFVPDRLREGEVVLVDEVAGQADLLRHLVELRALVRRKRVVLSVDRTGLQGGVDLGEGHRRRIRAERLAEELPCVRPGHPELHARKILWRLDVEFLPALAQVELALAEIHDRQQLDVELVFDLLLERVHEVGVENLHLLLGALQHVPGREDGEVRNEDGEFLRRCDRHLEIAARDGLQLGALLEEGGVPVRLETGEILDLGPEDVGQRDGALVVGRCRRRKPQGDLVIGQRRDRKAGQRCGRERRCRGAEEGTSSEVQGHCRSSRDY